MGLKGSLIDRIPPGLLLHDGMRMWCFETWGRLDIDRPDRQIVQRAIGLEAKETMRRYGIFKNRVRAGRCPDQDTWRRLR